MIKNKKKPAVSLVVSLGKAQNGMSLFLYDIHMVELSSLPVEVPQSHQTILRIESWLVHEML